MAARVSMFDAPAGAPGGAAPVLRALGTTPLRPLLLGAPRPARVLGRSRLAAYLAVADDDGADTVVAVVAGGAVRLPLSLALTGPLPDAVGPDRVEVGDGGATLGSARIVAARWWDPRAVVPRPADPRIVDDALAALMSLPPDAFGIDAGVGRAAVTALVRGDAQRALRILGLGPGLTPAGDDVVAGALAAVAVLAPPSVAARVPVTAVLERAPAATTLLSASLLRCAARGEVIPQADALLSALCGRGDALAALSGLRSVGATSGSALALGLVTGARTLLGLHLEDPR